MKVRVNRQLSAGKYHVNFEVGDFTPDEVGKMGSFGVPAIAMRWQTPNGEAISRVLLTQITKGLDGVFATEELAATYEKDVLNQIKLAMDALRSRQDEFSGSDEVDL